MIPYHFSSSLLNVNSYFDVGVDNDVSKCALLDKMMNGSACMKVHTLTNESGCYIMKLNY